MEKRKLSSGTEDRAEVRRKTVSSFIDSIITIQGEPYRIFPKMSLSFYNILSHSIITNYNSNNHNGAIG